MIGYYCIKRYVSINGTPYFIDRDYNFIEDSEMITEPIMFKSLTECEAYIDEHGNPGVYYAKSFNKQKIHFYIDDKKITSVSAYRNLKIEFSFQYEPETWRFNDLKYVDGELALRFLKQEWGKIQ